MNCGRCNAENPDGSRFCARCGAAVSGVARRPTPPAPTLPPPTLHDRPPASDDPAAVGDSASSAATAPSGGSAPGAATPPHHGPAPTPGTESAPSPFGDDSATSAEPPTPRRSRIAMWVLIGVVALLLITLGTVVWVLVGGGDENGSTATSSPTIDGVGALVGGDGLDHADSPLGG